ncbi:MAG: hypothetical protein ACI8R4_002470 [Paracoccaceae bacterium]|jgi:hypothetical protein
MIRLPDSIDAAMVDTDRDTALSKLARKKDASTDAATLSATYLGHLNEGDCLQTLHIGPYTDEAATLANLHSYVMPDLGLTFASAHHEIYLGDPRRAAPEKLHTILRQPRPA